MQLVLQDTSKLILLLVIKRCSAVRVCCVHACHVIVLHTAMLTQAIQSGF